MSFLAWFGALTVAVISAALVAFVGEYAYSQGWWLIGAPMRAVDWILGLWAVLLVAYPLWQKLRRKPIGEKTPFRLLAWPCVLVGVFMLIGGAVLYAQEAFRLGGFLGAVAAFIFFPVGFFLVAIFGTPGGFFPMFVMGVAAMMAGGQLRGDE